MFSLELEVKYEKKEPNADILVVRQIGSTEGEKIVSFKDGCKVLKILKLVWNNLRRNYSRVPSKLHYRMRTQEYATRQCTLHKRLHKYPHHGLFNYSAG